jgi:hypothetical protein
MKDTVLFVILLSEVLTQFLKQQYQAMNVQSDVEISVNSKAFFRYNCDILKNKYAFLAGRINFILCLYRFPVVYI